MLQKTIPPRMKAGFAPYSIPNHHRRIKPKTSARSEASRPYDDISVPITQQTETFSSEYFETLLKEERLVLLVDLDQTLVDTTDDSRAAYIKDVQSFTHGPDERLHFTRVRHKASSFLRNIARHYDLYACTFGSRNYATKMIRLLDPRGKYFKKTVFAREDSDLITHNSKVNVIEKAFANGSHMVCMVDDRADVWERRHNLVRVKPYFFFKNALKKMFHTDLLPAVADLTDDTKMEIENKEFFLEHLQSCLALIHGIYYDIYRKSNTAKIPITWEVMPYIRSRVMKGLSVTVDPQIFQRYPRENNELLAQYAEQMGAEVTDGVEDRTTHFISFGVEQDFRDRHSHMFVVNPQWLIYSHERWARINEKYFLA